MTYYGYIKKNGTNPNNNVWKKGRTITLNDNSTVQGYEGSQSKSDSNVEIIGKSKAFSDWLKENTPQQEII